jgi:sterol desaturase/sphingolipid hydroxylase (fatty acid hydroxylase superfamily)
MHAQHHEFHTPNNTFAGIYGDAFESALIAFFALWPLMIIKTQITAIVIFLFIIGFFVQLNHSGRKVELGIFYTGKIGIKHTSSISLRSSPKV